MQDFSAVSSFSVIQYVIIWWQMTLTHLLKYAGLKTLNCPLKLGQFFLVTYLALIAEYIWVKVTEFQHLSQRGFGKISKIVSYRTLWLHLSKLTQDLGNATGLTYGGQTLLLYAISVLVTYVFMMELTENFNYTLFCPGLLLLVINFCSEILLMVLPMRYVLAC